MRWSSCCTHPRRHLAMCHFRLNHSHYSWNREFHNIPDFATYIFVPDPWSEVNPFCELMKGRMHLKTMRLLEEGCHQCPCKISTVNFLFNQNYWQKSMAGTCERTFETPCSPHLIAGGPHIAFSVYTMIFYKVRLKTDKKVHNKLKVL